MSLSIKKNASEPRPLHVLKHPRTQTGLNSTWYTVLLLPFEFQASGIWGKSIPVDVFASEVSNMLPGSNLPKVSEARNAKTLAGIKCPQNSENPGIYGDCGGHSCSNFGNFGEI